MRAPPPIDVTLNRFGCWRGALGALALAAGATIAAWIASSAGQRPTSLLVGVALAAVGLLSAVVASLRVRAFDLRWDGAQWWWTDRSRPASVPVAGTVRVAMDLGSYLLLRFVDATPGRRRPARWLPLQRRGLEAQWHALRCAVHAPRPSAADAP